jgi:cyanophycinase-like exopeptidase
VEHFTKLGAAVEALPVVTRRDAQDPTLAARVGEANFVYLSGGRPDYLFVTLQGSLVWQAIQDVIGRGGLLAGCSAGAMILGRWIPGFPRWQRAFDLLPGAVVVPHFDEIPSWMVGLIHVWLARRGRLVGVPGYTALLVNARVCSVLGKGPVTVWDLNGKHNYSHGESLDWSA